MEGLSKNQGLQPTHAQQQQQSRGKSVESFEVWQMSDTRPMFRHLGRSLREFVCRELGFRSFCIVTVWTTRFVTNSLRSKKNMAENLWGIFKVVLEWSDQKYVLALKYLPMVHDMYKFYESYGTFINAWAGLICRALTARTSRIFGSVLQSLPGYRDSSRCTLLTTHK